MRALARDEERVRLLWDVCSIPDFRKLLFEVHVGFLEQLFVELARKGRLSDDFVASHVRELDDGDGDVETLVARIASTRTWTYVANREDWLEAPAEWQQTTRAIEDRLSDALHERLVARFVTAKTGRAAVRPRRQPHAATAAARAYASEQAVRVAPAHPFAKLAAMRAALTPDRPRSTSSGPDGAARVDEVVDAQHDELRLGADGRIVHVPSERVVGAVVAGQTIALPDVRLVDADVLGGGARARLDRRLLAFVRDVAEALLGGVRDLATREAAPGLRGLAHRLEHGLGTVRASEARVALASIFWGPMAPPRAGATSFTAPRRADPRALAAIGYPAFGGRAIRADVAERAAVAWSRAEADDGRDARAFVPTLASWLGCSVREVPAVVHALAGGPRSRP